jgi:nitroimidazol reductase NimA-like FMN-containing flavoprotein (pyridoxamine 5'-phosphate oxidase superfamily)
MGKKTEIIADNPKICLQVEKVADIRSWQSVIVYGTAEELADEPARAEALKAIVAVNPTLTPAVSIRWMDSWVRENIEVIYRVTPSLMTGRATVKRPEMRAAIIPGEKQRRGDVQ